jgi:uncharacterized membrane protein
MLRLPRQLLRVFITGLLAALPLAATVAIFAWAFALLGRWVGPSSPVGGLLSRIGLGVTGSEIVGYLIGLAIILFAILMLGLLVELGLQRSLGGLVDAVMQRIPLVRSVYDLLQRFVGLMSPSDSGGTRAMRPVWCHFGGRAEPHSAVLALQSSPEVVIVDGRRCLIVMVPTAPVPVGGGLITSLYVSMGVTAPQYLQLAERSAGST